MDNLTEITKLSLENIFVISHSTHYHTPSNMRLTA